MLTLYKTSPLHNHYLETSYIWSMLESTSPHIPFFDALIDLQQDVKGRGGRGGEGERRRGGEGREGERIEGGKVNGGKEGGR